MGRNVEIKARLVDPEACFERARAIADGPEQELAQRDTFFASAQGRLKLRELSERVGCLIYYERPDAEGPKLSRYILTETGDPSGLRTALAAAWGVIGEVRKRRRLLMVGRTRIHIDAVDGLVDTIARRLHAAGKVSSLHQDAGFHRRLIELEKEFPRAGVLLHKAGILPEGIQNLWAHPTLVGAAQQLGGEVADRALDLGARASQLQAARDLQVPLRTLEDPSEAEVGQEGGAVEGADEHVGGLDVAVQDAALVGVAQRVGEGGHQLAGLPGVEGAVLGEAGGEVAAPDELHGEPGPAVIDAVVVDRGDVGMGEAEGAAVATETAEERHSWFEDGSKACCGPVGCWKQLQREWPRSIPIASG